MNTFGQEVMTPHVCGNDMEKLSILAIGAHPDDVEVLCGGTLAKYAKLGHRVTICHALNGDLGHFYIPRPELARVRAEEARRAGALIGAEVISLDISDLDIYPDKETRMKFTDIIRRAKPDVIITHSPDDYMPDHTTTAQLVFEASFTATLPQLVTEYEFHPKVTPVYYMDTLAGVNFLPQEYVDITDVIEVKKKMLEQHESQLTWMKDHDHIDFMDFMLTQSKFRGLQCGVAYAEGFRRMEVWPRIPTGRVLP